uniref:DUF834 domain-containing protein n=1 Tax=Oryza rufipogon TaxID=4529 RepID=A0A0E0MTH6_ORYRU
MSSEDLALDRVQAGRHGWKAAASEASGCSVGRSRTKSKGKEGRHLSLPHLYLLSSPHTPPSLSNSLPVDRVVAAGGRGAKVARGDGGSGGPPPPKSAWIRWRWRAGGRVAVDPAWRGRSQKWRGWGARWWASGAMAVPCADPTVAAVPHPEAGGGRSIAEVVARGVWRWREEAAAAAIPRVDPGKRRGRGSARAPGGGVRGEGCSH